MVSKFKRQLQLHELKTRIASYSAKIDAHQRAARAKDDLLEASLKQLEKEKLEVDSMKLKLDEAIREKSSVKERLESLANEKIYSERKFDKLQEDLVFVEKEKSILNESKSRANQELKTIKAENDRLESTNKHLSKENKERINLISQLETVGSSLREQLIITKEELKIVTQKFDNYKAAASEPIKAEAGGNSKVEFDLDERLLASKKREDQLETNIITLEKNQVTLKVS
jgi:chromosome segregation ATPase